MFSGTKFRFWSRQSSSKKDDTEKESSKNKSKSTTLPKGEDEGRRQPNTHQEKFHLQKLHDDHARLEDAVEELTPFKTKALALEKKLVYITRSFEKKQNRYSTAIASLEAENEQLQEEIRRMKSICSSCYFCSRHQMTAHPEAVKHFQSLQRTDHSSNESLVSSKSWRRLQKLEEEQSAIVEETSRQKQETSRCLEQISSEVMKALVSQKVLRRDCAQLQSRIQQLEKQNSQLNDAIFRQYPLHLSQTNFLTGQRNENVSVYHPQLELNSPWDEHSLPRTSAMETLKYEEQTTSRKLFRYPPNQRFGVDNCRPTSDCVSYNYIPEQVVMNSSSVENISTNRDCRIATFDKDVSLVDSVAQTVLCKNAKHSLGDFFRDIRNEGKTAHNWELSTSSTLTLRDETINGEDDSQCKNSFSRGSTFSLNDILDGDIDELQFPIQSPEVTNSDFACKTSNISWPVHGSNAMQHQPDCPQQNSKPLMFVNDTKDISALQITSGSCEKIFKVQGEPSQVPFSIASKYLQSGISLDNFDVAKQETAAEKRHRYSYPAALPAKSVVDSEEHKLYFTKTENATAVKMAEASKVVQTVTKAKQAVQKFQLWNFETFFDESDTGTIKERTVPVTRSQHQISKHEVGPTEASAERDDAEKAINKNAKISTSAKEDMLQKDVSQRLASDETPEKCDLTQESFLEDSTTNQGSPALQNLSQSKHSQRNILEEAPTNTDTYISDGNPLMACPPLNNAMWINDMRVTAGDTKPSINNLCDASQAMHTFKQQDNKQDSKPNNCDYHPEPSIRSEERKHGQNDIPAESVDKKVEMESIVHKKRERFNALPNENISKDLAKDENMSKDKVMALTAYFEEVHVEQCPDCQQSDGRKCRISSPYRHALGSKDNSLSEDDSKQMDGNTAIDLDQNHIHASQHDANETHRAGKKQDLLPNDLIVMSPMSIRETSKCEAAVTDAPAGDMSVQRTPHLTSDDFNRSENASSSDAGLKVGTSPRWNSSLATSSQIEGTLLSNVLEETDKTVPQQLKHKLISSVGESKSVTNKIENTEDHRDRELKTCMSGGANLMTATSVEQMVSKRTQSKSLPSVSLSSSDVQSPLQVKYIRTLSLKSFSDALTPPPSPKSHKENEKTKRSLGQAYGLTQESSADMFKINEITQEPQYQRNNQRAYQPQGSSQSNNNTLSERQAQDTTTEEPQGHLQAYAQVNCQGHSQAKQFTVFSEDKSEAQRFPQWRHLHSQIHSTNEEQFEVYSHDQSRFCAQNYPQDQLTRDILYPGGHHSPKMNPFPADEAFKTRLQEMTGCPMLSSADIQPDDRRDDLTCSAYPDLLSSSHPKVTMCRSKRSHEMEGKCNVLTEEDIMKYRLDCHDSRRTTEGGYPRELQSNSVSIADMDSPGDSHGLRMLSTKPPLPPRRFHVTKYYVRDDSNPLLDPNDFFNFENELFGFMPGTPHADPTRNEFLTEANQRTTIWDRERTHPSPHSRGADFNYQGADAMRQHGETNSLGLDTITVCHPHLIENSKAGICVSPSQGYQPVVNRQSSCKRNSYPDCSGKDYSQPHAWWEGKDNAAATTWHHPLQRDQITRPVSFHPTTQSANYQHSLNHPLNAATEHRKPPVHCRRQLESESSQKNSKDSDNDFVFNEISKQIENLRQTVSELQKKSTEN